MALIKNKKINSILFSVFILTAFFCIPFVFSRSDVYAMNIGETRNFSIDPGYDALDRKEIAAILLHVSDRLYFYVDVSWWEEFSPSQKEEIKNSLSDSASEFDKNIYPTITSNFGPEWKPGIDNDDRITVLIHPMRKGAGGYFNSGNEYQKIEIPASNQREMFYINSDYVSSYLFKGFLAHEFTHLVTFNQKEKIHNIEEEVWLNEARAEYASSLCGYDKEYQMSNLRRRVVEFLKNPSDSITDWHGSSSDYGVLNLFIQYLVDYYGVKILNDSLHSDKIGIESINYALEKSGYKEDFSQIFTDWTVAILVNNCSIGPKYCYKNENLKNVRVFPESNVLPVDSNVTLSANYVIKNWAAYWNEITGAKGTLTFEFDGAAGGNFKVSYLICDNSDKCSIVSLVLDKNQNGKIVLEDFDKKYSSLTVISSLQNKNNGANHSFLWRAQSEAKNNGSEDDLIKNLLEQIDYLKTQISAVEEMIRSITGSSDPVSDSCSIFKNDLYFGMTDNQEVKCLQTFLKDQDSDIYPEGKVTGNFLTLTKSAVIRFQEKYFDEILKTLGLSKGTGYVGEKTREKINQMLK